MNKRIVDIRANELGQNREGTETFAGGFLGGELSSQVQRL